MADKLRKIGDVLWYNKERIVLAIMLAVLCWRGYGLVNPPPPPAPHHHDPPKPPDENLPRPPAVSPLNMREMVSWKSAYSPDPFWYYSTPAGTNATQRPESQDPGITLLQIKEMAGGKYKAQLQTSSTPKKWCSEGETFDQFEVRSINFQAGTCDVYSRQSGRVITLRQS